MAISFKGAPFPKDVILHAVFFYLRYGVSYRDLEEIMAERCVSVGHATLNRWIIKFAPLVAERARRSYNAGSAQSWASTLSLQRNSHWREPKRSP
ncbi:hypothetical protein RUE5091_01908 [Ruegeria denitrificans]|uniref:Transposase n=1 Tax=Ruegeria denitrificans TaxID=1715692 RepID=A0A0P1I8N8_9RHOB|nr:hypothetical protein RUE5091_01908 [Ruegeria denitrificans]